MASLPWRCAVLCLVAQSCPTLWNPMDCSPLGSSIYGDHQARILEWLSCPPPGDLPNAVIKPRSPTLQVGFFVCLFCFVFLPSEPPGKPMNTVMGSLSLLKVIFPTQESNRISCIAGRWILYQLSYQASPWPGKDKERLALLDCLWCFYSERKIKGLYFPVGKCSWSLVVQSPRSCT